VATAGFRWYDDIVQLSGARRQPEAVVMAQACSHPSRRPAAPGARSSLALLFLAALFWASALAASAPLRVRIPRSQGQALPTEIYYARLLALALEKTRSTDGDYVIVPLYQSVTSDRLIHQLADPPGQIDVLWTSNSAAREKLLRPVKISILRGLNSYRLFLIREGEQSRFDRIRTVSDLRGLKAGQGAQWPDTAVLLANGLPVVVAARSELLFDMLKRRRFDYFPRGLNEIWDEQRLHAGDRIVIEATLMLHYPAPIYFFVNKNNAALASRIERGLRIAQQDGSFEALFLSVPTFRQGYELIKRKDRKVLELWTDFPDQD
jgi:hypothetical protein